MKITDTEKIKKRLKRKIISDEIARDLLAGINKNGLKDSTIKRKLERQLNCSSKLEVYSNDVIRTWFCGQKTCPVCNSIRMAKYANLYQKEVEKFKYSYMLVLTMESPYSEFARKEVDKIIEFRNFLKNRIDEMFNFFHNSMMCKTDIYKKLIKKVKMLRTWEITFNKKLMFHPHFHILLIGNDNGEIETLGNLMINYWLKWWNRKNVKCVREAQNFEPLRKSILEVMHYCLKPTDLKNGNPIKILEIIKATNNRRLFTQKGFKTKKELDAINKKEISDIEDHKIDNIMNAVKRDTFYFDSKIFGFYSKATGEILIP